MNKNNNFPRFFLLLSLVFAVLVSFPVIFANEAGGSGGDGGNSGGSDSSGDMGGDSGGDSEADSADAEAADAQTQAQTVDPVLEGDKDEDAKEGGFFSNIAGFFSNLAKAVGFAIGLAVAAVTGGLVGFGLSLGLNIASIGSTGKSTTEHGLDAFNAISNKISSGKRDATPSSTAEMEISPETA